MDLTQVFSYLGYHWDLKEGFVQLPDRKKSAYTESVKDLMNDIQSGDFTNFAKKAPSVLGRLIHSVSLHRFSPSNVCTSYAVIEDISSLEDGVVKEKLLAELKFWLVHLEGPCLRHFWQIDDKFRFFDPYPYIFYDKIGWDQLLITDSSPNGWSGLLYHENLFVSKLESLKGSSAYFEFLGFLKVVGSFQNKLNGRLMLLGDNTAHLAAVNKRMSKSPILNKLARRLTLIEEEHGFECIGQYIPSECMGTVDHNSKEIAVPFTLRLRLNLKKNLSYQLWSVGCKLFADLVFIPVNVAPLLFERGYSIIALTEGRSLEAHYGPDNFFSTKTFPMVTWAIMSASVTSLKGLIHSANEFDQINLG